MATSPPGRGTQRAAKLFTDHPTNKLTIRIGNREINGFRVYDFAGLHEVPELTEYIPLPHYTDDFGVYEWKGLRQPAAYADYDEYLQAIINIRNDREYIPGSSLLIPLGRVSPRHYVWFCQFLDVASLPNISIRKVSKKGPS